MVFTNYIFFWKNVASDLREYKADCNLYATCSFNTIFHFSRNVSMGIDKCTFFGNNAKCQSHTARCVGI